MSNRLEFLSLEGRNVFSYKHFKLPLSNQGLVSLKGANGSGKCITGDTIVYTTNGMIPIENLVDRAQHGFAPLKLDLATICGIDTTTKCYREIAAALIDIETKAGFSLSGTKEHPLLTINEEEIGFKTLKDLRIGDYVAIQKKIDTWSHTDFEINGFESYPECPKVLDGDLAWLLGIVLSGGYINGPYIIFVASNKNMCRRIKNIFTCYFPKIPYEISKKGNIKINMELISPFFESVGLFLNKNGGVPVSILQSTRKSVLNFLDGYVSATINKNKLLSTNKTLITQLHLILQNFGIICRKRRWYKQNDKKLYWALDLDKSILKKFIRASKRDMEFGADWDDLLSKSICKTVDDHKISRTFEEMCNNYIYWDQIVSKRRINKKSPVYDLKINESNPTFIANGFVNHNSSIFSTLDNVLYATTARGLRYKDLINIHSGGKNYYVKLKFMLDNIEYVIKSYRNHTKHGTRTDVWKAGQLITKHLNKDNVKTYIPQLIGVDRTSFLSTIYLSQEHQHILVSGTPKEKERYLMWLFNLHKYEKLAGQCTDRKKVLNKFIDEDAKKQERLNELEQRINELPTLTSIKKSIEKTTRRKLGLRATISILDKRLSNLSDLEVKIGIRNDLLQELGTIQLEENPTTSDILKLEKEVDGLNSKIAALRSDLKQVKRAKQIQDELASIQDTRPISEIQNDSEKIGSEKTILTKIELPGAERAQRLRKNLSKMNKPAKTTSELEEEIDQKQTEVRRAEKEIAKLHITLRKGVCPTCKRPWDLTQEQLDKLQKEVEIERIKLEVKNKELFKLTALKENAETYRKINKELKDLPTKDPFDIKRAIAANIKTGKQLAAELAIATRRNELKAIVTRAPNRKADNIATELTDLTDSLKNKRGLLKNSIRAKEILDRLAKLPIDHLDKIIKNRKEAKSELKAARLDLEKAIKLLERYRLQLKEIKFLTEKSLSLYEEVKKSKRAKADIEIWGSLETCFNTLLRKREQQLLEQLTSAIPNYTKPLFNIHSKWLVPELVKNDGIDLNLVSKGKAIPKKGISPGQRSKLGLASIFGLRDIYDSSCNLLILDEPLVWIDEEGKDGFIDIIRQLKSKIGTIIIIDHGSEIKGLDFDHIWEASIDSGISTLKMR